MLRSLIDHKKNSINRKITSTRTGSTLKNDSREIKITYNVTVVEKSTGLEKSTLSIDIYFQDTCSTVKRITLIERDSINDD